MNPETKFWKQLKERFPDSWHVTRIENSSSRGTPDINVCTDFGIEIWIELKHGEARIRPEQRVFGIRRTKAGGKVFVLCQTENWVSAWQYPIDMEAVQIGNYTHFRITCPPLFTVPLYNVIPELRDYLCRKFS